MKTVKHFLIQQLLKGHVPAASIKFSLFLPNDGYNGDFNEEMNIEEGGEACLFKVKIEDFSAEPKEREHCLGVQIPKSSGSSRMIRVNRDRTESKPEQGILRKWIK